MSKMIIEKVKIDRFLQMKNVFAASGIYDLIEGVVDPCSIYLLCQRRKHNDLFGMDSRQ